MRVSPLVVLVGILVTMVATVGAALFTYTNVRQIVIDSLVELPAPPQFNTTPQPTALPLVNATAAPTQTANAGVPATVNPNVTPTLATWTDPKRFTILLLGIDQRTGEKGPFRTDTIMVLSLDPVRKTASMLSIPRDIYLTIPYNTGVIDRINNANVIGDLHEYPGGGGPKLAERTVEQLLGIQIDRYVVVNFDAFTKVLDTIGPITVCPPTRIFDDHYPAYVGDDYITVEFKAGCQEVDATRALEYARVRHNAGDDMGRAQRQQEVIKAVKDRAKTLGGLSKLIGQALPLWNSIKDNIKTDLTFDEILQLAQLAQDIKDIRSDVMTIKTKDGGQLIPTKLITGEEVLSPVYEDLHQLVVRLFDAGRSAPANADPRATGTHLAVLNGAGIDGLGKSTADKLTNLGFDVVQIKNADALGSYAKSEIHVYGADKMDSARYLAQILGASDPTIVQESNGAAGVDIELIVGKDLAPK